jgi:hypothetical protein
VVPRWGQLPGVHIRFPFSVIASWCCRSPHHSPERPLTVIQHPTTSPLVLLIALGRCFNMAAASSGALSFLFCFTLSLPSLEQQILSTHHGAQEEMQS